MHKFSLIAFDFDGVLTDNRVWVLQDGNEAVLCSRADGLAFDMFRIAGVETLIISTEQNMVVSARARKLKVPVLQAVADKWESLRKHCETRQIPLAEVLFVGNDLNDLNAMAAAGASACPSDAHPLIKERSRFILQAKGGEGVAREIAESILGLDYELLTHGSEATVSR